MFDSSDLIYPIIEEHIIDNELYYSIQTEIVATLIKVPKNLDKIAIIAFLADYYSRNPMLNNFYPFYDVLKVKFSDMTDEEIEFYKLKYV